MYIPSTAVAAATLLFAYEWAPGLLRRTSTCGIPESANRTPDLLDEVRYGLSWILSLQEPSGVFRHSETVIEWSPQVPADRIARVRWVAERSSSATAKAVAVLAMAARVFRKVGRPLLRPLCDRRPAGLAFSAAHPEHLRAVRKGGSSQPLWDDEPNHNDTGARFVAAVEMWRSFRDRRRRFGRPRSLLAAAPRRARAPRRSWRAPGPTSAGSRSGRWPVTSPRRPDMREEAERRLVAAANLLRARVEKTDGYRCASAPEDYFWASNSNLMEKLLVLAMAARLAPEGGLAAGGGGRPVALDPRAQPERLLDGHPGRERP